MDASEPRVRRRGFFLHSETTGEPDTGEHENPEGVAVRARLGRSSIRRQVASASALGGRSHTLAGVEDSDPQIRSGSVTGSRQRAHLPR
jgi:hypothetical protein